MLSTLHHTAIICSDLERSLVFYQKLGFTLLRKVWRENQQDYLTLLRCGEITLELFVKPQAPRRPTQPEAMGLRHLAFRVEDVAQAASWLNDLGIPTEPIREDPVNGGRFTFFRDPDDLPLELHE